MVLFMHSESIELSKIFVQIIIIKYVKFILKINYKAIGRVIRHKDDFGSVYLCDNRFS